MLFHIIHGVRKVPRKAHNQPVGECKSLHLLKCYTYYINVRIFFTLVCKEFPKLSQNEPIMFISGKTIGGTEQIHPSLFVFLTKENIKYNQTCLLIS